MKAIFTVFALLAASACVSCDLGGAGCSTTCGNGVCDYNDGESCANCNVDCGLCPTCTNECGNGLCEELNGETTCNCPQDCGACCLDDFCNPEGGENETFCSDCESWLNGRITECETGKPIGLPNMVRVLCKNDRHDGLPVLGTADYYGRFKFGPVMPGLYECTAESSDPGFLTGRLVHYAQPGLQHSSAFQIPLCRAKSSLKVSVTSADASLSSYPILDNAKVVCFPSTPTGILPGYGVTVKWSSVAKGEVVLNDITVGNWSCSVSKEGYAGDAKSVRVKANHAASIKFALIPNNPGLVGVISTVDRQPIYSIVRIECITLEQKEKRPTNLPFFNVVDSKFFYPKIPPGRYSCTAEGDGFEKVCRECTVGSSVATNEACVFVLPSATGNIRGRVIDQWNHFIDGVHIECQVKPGTQPGWENHRWTAISSAINDEFVIGNLEPWVYLCHAFDPTKRVVSVSKTEQIVIESGLTSNVTFVMKIKTGEVTGVVQEPDIFGGFYLTGANISCYDSLGHVFRQSTGPTVLLADNTSWGGDLTLTRGYAKNYNFDGVEEGSLRCNCSMAGHYPAEAIVDINHNGQAVVDSQGVKIVDCVLTPHISTLTLHLVDNQTGLFISGNVFGLGMTGFAVEPYLYERRTPLTGVGRSPLVLGDLRTTLRLGDYQITPQSPGYFPPPQFVISVPSLAPVSTTIYFVPIPSNMSGVVYDSLSREPVVGALVTCSFLTTPGVIPPSTVVLTSVTDDRGVYRFVNIMTFDNTWSCVTSNSPTHLDTIIPQQGPPIRRDRRYRYDMWIDPVLGTLSIQIRDYWWYLSPLIAGGELAGVVCCTGPFGYSECSPDNQTIGPEPIVHIFAGLRYGNYSCTAEAGPLYTPTVYPGENPAWNDFFVPFVGVFPRTILMDPINSTVTGVVRNKIDGSPVEGAWIGCNMYAHGPWPSPWNLGGWAWGLLADSGLPLAVSNESGNWGPLSYPMQRVECAASKLGWEIAYPLPTFTNITDDHTDIQNVSIGENVDFELWIQPTRATLTGYVGSTNAAGAAVEGAVVTLSSSTIPRVEYSATTNATGWYELKLIVGEYCLERVEAPLYDTGYPDTDVTACLPDCYNTTYVGVDFIDANYPNYCFWVETGVNATLWGPINWEITLTPTPAPTPAPTPQITSTGP